MSAQAAISILILIPVTGFCLYTLVHVIRTLRK